MTYLNKQHHLQSSPYDTCNGMILWCWNSWHQRDSCEQDEDIPQISGQGNTRSRLKSKYRKWQRSNEESMLKLFFKLINSFPNLNGGNHSREVVLWFCLFFFLTLYVLIKKIHQTPNPRSLSKMPNTSRIVNSPLGVCQERSFVFDTLHPNQNISSQNSVQCLLAITFYHHSVCLFVVQIV